MNRQNQILSAILAVQIVILGVVFWPSSSSAEGERLFADVDVEDIVQVTIHGPGDQQVRLARGNDGWVLPEADDYPVLEDRVPSLLEKLMDIRLDRLVTRTSESHQRLEVADDEFQRLIEFELQDGTRHGLYLGSSPSFNVLHVRAEGQDEVYLALGISVSDAGTQASDWVNTRYFEVAQEEIVKITLENGNGRFEFERAEAGGDWTMLNLPAGETLLENNVSSLATRVSGLNMTTPLGREGKPEYGMDDPNAKFTLVTRDEEGNEQTHIVRVGAELEAEQGYVVKSAASPYYVLMATFTVEDLLERTMEGFIQVPPTPTPEATPAPEATPTPTS